MNPKTPKQTFLEGVHAKPFADLSGHPALLAALDYSILEMVNRLPSVEDAQTAAANNYQLQGARALRFILLTIADPPTRQPQPRGDNLPNPDA